MAKKKVDHSDPFHVHVLTTREMIRILLDKFKSKKIVQKQPAFSNTPSIKKNSSP